MQTGEAFLKSLTEVTHIKPVDNYDLFMKALCKIYKRYNLEDADTANSSILIILSYCKILNKQI